MRPKKNILLWAERENEAGIVAFLLNQQPAFMVEKADNERTFAIALREGLWDLVIIPRAIHPPLTAKLVSQAYREQQCPVLALACGKDGSLEVPEPDPMRELTGNAWLLKQAHALTKAKRGPRKGFHWGVVDGRRRQIRPETEPKTLTEVA